MGEPIDCPYMNVILLVLMVVLLGSWIAAFVMLCRDLAKEDETDENIN